LEREVTVPYFWLNALRKKIALRSPSPIREKELVDSPTKVKDT
jgi:hypothetical protein